MLAPPNFSLLLVMACFWLVFLLVWTLLVKPLGTLMDERAHRIDDAQSRFEAAQAGLRDALVRCERELSDAGVEAQRKRQDERRTGETTRRATMDAARGRASDRLTQLDLEIAQATDEARGSLRMRVSELARKLASQLIGREVV
jgi:F-type H+-transporting ATPase subunit b